MAWEYRRALKDRVSPPCGKPKGTLLHPRTIEEAESDTRKLVCFDCGIACDLTQMKSERLVALRKLDAHAPKRLPVVNADGALVGVDTTATTAAPEYVAPAPVPRKLGRGQRQAPVGFAQNEGVRWRIRYAKVGRTAFISHLDTMRLLMRLFRRARVEPIYSKGFHPKPQLMFAPALGLGVAALADVFDVRIDYDGDATELEARLNAAAPDGMVISAARRLGLNEPAISKRLARAEFAAWLPTAPDALRTEGLTVTRTGERGLTRSIDVAHHLDGARLVDGAEAAELRKTLGWVDSGAIVVWRTKLDNEGGARPVEVIAALTGAPPAEGVQYARTALWSLVDGALVDTMVPMAPPPPKTASASLTDADANDSEVVVDDIAS